MAKTIINDTNLEITNFKVNKQNELEELQINGNEVSLGEDVNLQDKEVEITSNGTTTIEPDSGYDGMSSVELSVNIPIPSTFTLYGWEYQDAATSRVYTIYTQKRQPEVGDRFWACTAVFNANNDYLALFGQISAVDEDTVTVADTPSGEYEYTFSKTNSDLTWNL